MSGTEFKKIFFSRFLPKLPRHCAMPAASITASDMAYTGSTTTDSFLISLVDDASASILDSCIADVTALYADVVVDKVTFGPLFKGFRLRPHGPFAFVPAELLQKLNEHPFIGSVRPSKLFTLPSWTRSADVSSAGERGGRNRNWGLDRIDQTHLPLDDEQYAPLYSGVASNVFVVDTGIDTAHIEFAEGQGSFPRHVENLWDAFDGDRAPRVGATVDDVGHGTHCAGIIGGQSVGVAPAANLFGIKVLNGKGEGSDVDIVRGLQFVLEWYKTHDHPPTVVSMSIGGVCSSRADCSKDVVVVAVEKLTAAGISVVVAAGNSDCDACLQTPAFAPSAITVGASDMQDAGAVFSDYGQCLDVFAPGVDISSACARDLCGTDGAYTSMSGTSMATPFVAGVVAQLLQMQKGGSPAELASMLACLAVPKVLRLQQGADSSAEGVRLGSSSLALTRNLLLQTPRTGRAEKTAACDLGSGCPGSCSSRGICQSSRYDESAADSGGDNYCLCDTDYWGEDCSVQEFGQHCGGGEVFLPYKLFNINQGKHSRGVNKPFAPTWSGVSFKVTTINAGKEVPLLSTSMCAGYEEGGGVCVRPGGSYRLQVELPPEVDAQTESKGGDEDGAMLRFGNPAVDARFTLAQTVGWEFCGQLGGAPWYKQEFVVASDGSCALACEEEVVELTLRDSFGDGWNGGYYRVADSLTGVTLAGGGMLEGATEQTHRLCLPPSQTLVLELNGGRRPFESSWTLHCADPELEGMSSAYSEVLATQFVHFANGIGSSGTARRDQREGAAADGNLRSSSSRRDQGGQHCRLLSMPRDASAVRMGTFLSSLNDNRADAGSGERFQLTTTALGLDGYTLLASTLSLETVTDDVCTEAASEESQGCPVAVVGHSVTDSLMESHAPTWHIASQLVGPVGAAADVIKRHSYFISCGSRGYYTGGGSAAYKFERVASGSSLAVPSGCRRSCLVLHDSAFPYQRLLDVGDESALNTLRTQYDLHDPSRVLASVFVLQLDPEHGGALGEDLYWRLVAYSETDNLAKELCYTAQERERACYRLVVGAGNYLSTPAQWSFCGRSDLPTSGVFDFCVENYTECSNVQQVVRVATQEDGHAVTTMGDGIDGRCTGEGTQLMLAMLSQGGTDKGVRATFELRQVPVFDLFTLRQRRPNQGGLTDANDSDDGMLRYSGVLADGDADAQAVCVVDGCYVGALFPTGAGTSAHDGGGEGEASPEFTGWVVCGRLFPAGAPVSFQVQSGICVVTTDPLVCQGAKIAEELVGVGVLVMLASFVALFYLVFRGLKKLCLGGGMASLDQFPLVEQVKLVGVTPGSAGVGGVDGVEMVAVYSPIAAERTSSNSLSASGAQARAAGGGGILNSLRGAVRLGETIASERQRAPRQEQGQGSYVPLNINDE